MTPYELFADGWRLAGEALASGEWHPLTEQEIEHVAALIGGDLRRIRAERTHDHRAAQGRTPNKKR